jgi:hypothetical protein
MQHYTLQQALAYNKSLPVYNRQTVAQIRYWYKVGYVICNADNLWYYFCKISSKYYRKYTTYA